MNESLLSKRTAPLSKASATFSFPKYKAAASATDSAFLKALAPAIASSSSCGALAAPLTPTPPTIWPSTTIGIPPCSGVKNLSGQADHCCTPVLDYVFEYFGRPFEESCRPSFSNRDLRSGGKGSVEPFKSHEIPRPSSTTAITPPGAFTLFASATAVAITRFAPSIVSDLFRLSEPLNQSTSVADCHECEGHHF